LSPVAEAMIARSWWKEALALPIGLGAGIALHDLPEKMPEFGIWLSLLVGGALLGWLTLPRMRAAFRWVRRVVPWSRIRQVDGEGHGRTKAEGEGAFPKKISEIEEKIGKSVGQRL
jgi:hypothetical protein